MRLNAGRDIVEYPHHILEAVFISLYDLHRFQPLEASLLGDLVFATCVHISLKVPDVGDISDITDLESLVEEVSVDHIKIDERAAVADMYVTVNSWAADIHSYVALMQRFEYLFIPG
jgi:hypothetical protein